MQPKIRETVELLILSLVVPVIAEGRVLFPVHIGGGTSMRPRLALLNQSPVLATESSSDFQALRQEILQKLKPQDVFEEIYALEYIHAQIDVARYSRAKRGILDLALAESVDCILKTARENGLRPTLGVKESQISGKWLSDQEFRKKVLSFLNSIGLDEAAIEGEAIRQKATELAQLDALLRHAQIRRDSCLELVTAYRRDLGSLKTVRVLPTRPPALQPPSKSVSN